MKNDEIVKLITEEIIAREIKIPIPVTVSNRHIHVDEHTRKILFGDNPLKIKKFLGQPGEFAAEETVKVIGPKGHFDSVRVVGPERRACQLEVSVGDCYHLGVQPVVRDSGDIEGTPGIYIAGPCGMVQLTQGVIVARRHIHMLPADAQRYGIKDKQLVRIRFSTGMRRGVLGDVIVRVNENYALECHLDIDEANALCIKNNDTVYLEIGEI
ncbi:MAG: phosphate propanoyltransferase [Tepidanaerobacter acetatoxydans]|uniref:phosphate propanoyltransferase n=1 Tax=Tepidanaerobacter TaxID=499228 RepID=UPI000ABF2703|nr:MULTISPECIES: phosphate propanoyltransferase [Tepidanaerobacter]NLU09925.1 phosphate propanoyltransferase [Tepidanaerobacter acetatoxydans]